MLFAVHLYKFVFIVTEAIKPALFDNALPIEL
jgi:hypothetical protein